MQGLNFKVVIITLLLADALTLHAATIGEKNRCTPETVYRVAICPGGNIPYIRIYPINDTVFNLIYTVGSLTFLPYK